MSSSDDYPSDIEFNDRNNDFDGDNQHVNDLNDILDGHESPNIQSEDDNEALTKFIQDNYANETKDQYLAPLISEVLAKTIDQWATVVPQKEDLKVAFQDCKIPSNVSSLGPIKINDIIYNRLSPRAKEYDRKLRNTASYIKRAMGPLSYIWDSLIKAQTYNSKRNLNPPGIKTNDKVIPLKDLMAAIAHAIKLLCLSNSLNLQSRKSALWSQLDLKYYPLTSQNNPVTTQLFGDNLEQRVSDIYKISQAARNPRFNTIKTRQGRCTVISYPREKFKTTKYHRQTTNNPRSYYKWSNYGQQPRCNFGQYQQNNPNYITNHGRPHFHRHSRGHRAAQPRN